MSKSFSKEKYDSHFIEEDFAFSVFINYKMARNKKLPFAGSIRFYFSTMKNKNTVCSIFSSENYKDRFIEFEKSGIALYNKNDDYNASVGRKESFRKAINDLAFSSSLYEKKDGVIQNMKNLMWKRYLAYEKKSAPIRIVQANNIVKKEKCLEIKIIATPTNEDWLNVKSSALTTMGLNVVHPPGDKWKKMILMSEHSPIRGLQYIWEWKNIPYFVSVHISRHKIGIEHFVKTQRNDRQSDYDRNKAPQDSLVTHKCIANAQAIINISKKRLCCLASKETREIWQIFINKLSLYEPLLTSLCVPNCVYRNGLCGEPKSCGYNHTEDFEIQSNKYINLFLQ